MKAILLPTDFSSNSLNAIEYAVAMFQDQPCNFYLLNVQKASSFISDDMLVVDSSATIYKTLVDAAKKSIENIITTQQQKNPNKKHHFFSIVDYDNFVDAINQAVEKYQIDLIVMGTKGATGLDRILFGSNTVHVINRCKTPILAIPKNCRYEGLRKVAFTANHIALYNSETLLAMKSILKKHDANLTILHLADKHSIASKQSINLAFFDEHFSDARHEYIDAEDKDIVSAITEYMYMNNFKMLGMVKKQHSFFERLLKTYPEEQIAYNFNFPFLVMTNFE